MIARYLILSVLLTGFVVVSTFKARQASGLPTPAPSNSIPVSEVTFSHTFHGEMGLECVDCHGAAVSSALSTDDLRAGHPACEMCHEEQLLQECGYCHVDPENIGDLVSAERELLFSHAQHVSMEGTECQTCHAGVAESGDLASITLPSMESCYTCHNDQVVSNTCEMCHSDFVSLVPTDHKRSDFSRVHREVTRLGGLDQTCQTCHAETFCLECHQGSGLRQFGRADMMSDPMPKTAVDDGPTVMKQQNVHALNYRFDHAIDARARQTECATCHEPQTFCAECHAVGGNINQVRFKPASHGVAGFTTLGVGSGGGLHAEEARRDMESCISCHDVEGQDPTCMTCHTMDGRVR